MRPPPAAADAVCALCGGSRHPEVAEDSKHNGRPGECLPLLVFPHTVLLPWAHEPGRPPALAGPVPAPAQACRGSLAVGSLECSGKCPWNLGNFSSTQGQANHRPWPGRPQGLASTSSDWTPSSLPEMQKRQACEMRVAQATSAASLLHLMTLDMLHGEAQAGLTSLEPFLCPSPLASRRLRPPVLSQHRAPPLLREHRVPCRPLPKNHFPTA